MVTVSFIGGPGDGFNVFSALRAWLSPHEAVVPGAGDSSLPASPSSRWSKQDTEADGRARSRTAAAAALCQLNITSTRWTRSRQTEKGMPAAAAPAAG